MNAEEKKDLDTLLEYIFRNRNDENANDLAFAAACENAAWEICAESGNAALLISQKYESILEIGGYYGAFTERLAQKCARLVCAEKDDSRRQLIRLRCPSAELCAEISDESFGLIWINGCDEPLSDYGIPSLSAARDLLHKRLLPDGRLIFLLPVKKLDEAKDAFGENMRVIYPYPNIKGAVFFFTDERLPKKSELSYDRTLCPKENDGKCFSDRFLAVVGKSPEKERLIFSKMSVSRKDAFKIRTDIMCDEKKYAVKTAMPESVPHVNMMAHSCERLSEIYGRGLIAVNKARKISDGQVRFDFEEGEELFDIIIRTAQRSPAAAWEYIFRYSEILRSKAVIPFEFTADFYKMFGRSLKYGGFYSCGYTNIDFCFDNIIVSGGRWTVTDYEFCADFPVPVDFVIFRSVFYLFRKMPENTVPPECEDEIYERLGISAYTDSFRKMEYNFQRYITGDGPYLSDVIGKCREKGYSPSAGLKKAVKFVKNNRK